MHPPSQSAPLVSILIPTRNRAALLASTVREALDQDYAGPVEIVVSDNASVDHTEAVLSSIPGENMRAKNWSLRALRHPSNIGIVANFNFLLEEARGALLAFHLDDDRWDSTYLRNAVSALERNPSCTATLTANRTHDDAGNSGAGWLLAHKHPLTSLPPEAGERMLRDVLGTFVSRPAFNLTQLVFRRTSLRFDPADGPHFDAVFFLCLLQGGPVWVDHTTRCSFRITGEAYGRSDVLGNPQADNLLYSHAVANALAKIEEGRTVPRWNLTSVACRRGLKSAIHFTKALRSHQPAAGFLKLACRLALGTFFGWRRTHLGMFSNK